MRYSFVLILDQIGQNIERNNLQEKILVRVTYANI